MDGTWARWGKRGLTDLLFEIGCLISGNGCLGNGQWSMGKGDLPGDRLKYHLCVGSIDLVMRRKRRGSMGRMEKKGKDGERIWRKGGK